MLCGRLSRDLNALCVRAAAINGQAFAEQLAATLDAIPLKVETIMIAESGVNSVDDSRKASQTLAWRGSRSLRFTPTYAS